VAQMIIPGQLSDNVSDGARTLGQFGQPPFKGASICPVLSGPLHHFKRPAPATRQKGPTMTSTRFAPRGTPDPNSRFANLGVALRGTLTDEEEARFHAADQQKLEAWTKTEALISSLLAPASPDSAGENSAGLPRGTSSRLLAHRLNTYSRDQAEAAGPDFFRHWQAVRAPSASTAVAPVTPEKVSAGPAIATPPKPMPVPAHIEAKGPECARAYRDSFRKANQRCLALLANPATRGRHIAVGHLIGQGLTDAQIITRLPLEASDAEQRVMMRRAEVSSMWDRAIALNNPGMVTPSTPAATSNGPWDRAIAKLYHQKG